MIEIIAVILFVVAWFALLLVAFSRFLDNGIGDIHAWLCGGLVVWMLALVVNAMVEYEKEHPCVTYESRLTYNNATKTMMPMRVCVERGEWEVGNE